MKIDALFQNIFNIFLFALIIQIAILALFSLGSLRDLAENRAVKIARDVVIVALAGFLCYKVGYLNIFRGTGVALTRTLYIPISALVLVGMINLIRTFFDNVRRG